MPTDTSNGPRPLSHPPKLNGDILGDYPDPVATRFGKQFTELSHSCQAYQHSRVPILLLPYPFKHDSLGRGKRYGVRPAGVFCIHTLARRISRLIPMKPLAKSLNCILNLHVRTVYTGIDNVLKLFCDGCYVYMCERPRSLS